MQSNNWKRVAGTVSAVVLASTQMLSAMPAFAEEEAYIYGTVNLPYADYYYGELNDVEENAEMDLEAEDPAAAIRAEGYVDAVTSATNTKSVKYGATCYTENEDGSVTVEGIKDVAIAVPQSLYDEATAAIEAGSTCNNQLLAIVGGMTVNEDQTVVPDEYKVLNGDGTLTAMVDVNEGITVADAAIEVTTNTKYGNYQLSISDEDGLLPDSDTMEGVVITTSDGAKYAMLHVDNLWLRTGEIAFAIEDGYVVHSVNTLKYMSFADMVGKTVTEVRYIVRGGADVTFATESYLPILHEGTAAAESVPVTAGEFAVTLTDLPEDYAATANAADLNTTYSEGVLTYDPTDVQPGSYSVEVTDESGVYASISTSVILTTDELPAVFDSETNAIVAAEGADEAAFANYLSKLSTATVNGTSYTLSGRKSTKIFDTATGAMDLTVASGDALVFGETGTYEVVVSATGYTTDLVFSVDVTVAESVTGDVNGDDQVTISDATLVLTMYAKYAAGLSIDEYTESQKKTADVNGDGIVDISDATSILTYYAQNAAGLNPTWDAIIG